MKKTFKVEKLSDLQAVYEFIKIQCNSLRNVVLLHGDLGSGKTAFVKYYVNKELGLEADSPTFSLVNEYSNGTSSIYHFDLYRLKDAAEIEDIGFWDYIDQAKPTFIEWPDKIAELLPENQYISVHISVNSNQCREYTISY